MPNVAISRRLMLRAAPWLFAFPAAILAQSPNDPLGTLIGPRQQKGAVPQTSAQASIQRATANANRKGLVSGTPQHSVAVFDELINSRLRDEGRAPIQVRGVDSNSVTNSVQFQRNLQKWLTDVSQRPTQARSSLQKNRRSAAQFETSVEPPRIGTAQPAVGAPTVIPHTRVFGGGPTPVGEFPDTVALVPGAGGNCGSFGGCSGTLIGRNVVLTAAHCVVNGCPKQVFFGGNVKNNDGQGVFIAVKVAIMHPAFDQSRTNFSNDVAVLILAQDVDALPSSAFANDRRPTPRAFAARAEVEVADHVTVVGFGYTSIVQSDFGVKNQVETIVTSCDCRGAGESETYGCRRANEMVAGRNGLDSCNGDSGGPAYVYSGGEFKLAGITSRPTNNATVPCGDGGIYTLVPVYASWIIATAKGHGGHMQ